MKTVFTFFFTLALFIGVNAQKNSITPYTGLSAYRINVWGDTDNGLFNDIGVLYEREITENIVANVGVSRLDLLRDELALITFRVGGTYHIINKEEGIFFGLDFQRGTDVDGGNVSGDDVDMDFGISYQVVNAKVGYSIPLGIGNLKPSIGIGRISVVGFGIGGFYLPINVGYSYSF